MSKTLQERFLAALIVRGEKEIKRLTGCIVVSSRLDGRFYYIGSSGSLRFGATRQGSLPCAKSFKQKLLNDR